ncbi:MAG: ABC transporter ATP-binding protein, partial [Gaiellaceae bacterium]
MPCSMIRLDGVTKRFGEIRAVDDASFCVDRGEVVAVLGPSGCGKTTLLRVVAGFERPDAGVVEIDGRTVSTGTSWVPPEQRRIGMVFQDYALFPHLTVAENVGFGLRRRRRPERVPELLSTVGLEGLGPRYPHELSGGQQQRVALARALVNRPAALLLDEPLGALDLKLRKRLQLELSQIHRDVGTTFVYVTHDQEEALLLSDRIGVMDRGRLHQVASPRELYDRPGTAFVA